MQGCGGTTSPVVKALVMLLAVKAFQHLLLAPVRKVVPQAAGSGTSWVARAGALAACSVTKAEVSEAETCSLSGLGGALPGGLGGLPGWSARSVPPERL